MPTLRYWAGAEAAAGTHDEELDAATVEDAVRQAEQAHPALAAVLPHCALLLDGVRVDREASLPADAVLEVLPPFAGG